MDPAHRAAAEPVLDAVLALSTINICIGVSARASRGIGDNVDAMQPLTGTHSLHALVYQLSNASVAVTLRMV